MLSRATDLGLLAARNGHARDARVRFDEGPHVYYVDGTAIGASVTGLLKEVEGDPFDAEAVSLRKSRWPDERYNAGVDRAGKWIPMTPKAIRAQWDLARDLGTDLHARIEKHLNGEVVCVKDTHAHQNLEEFLQAMRWIAACGLEPYRTEWVIFDEDADVAGSIDFVARDPATGALVIIDWKRCRNGDDVYRFSSRRDGVMLKPPLDHLPDTTLSHWAAQVNLYRIILERHYAVVISRMQMVCVYAGQGEARVYEHARDDRVAALLDRRMAKK